MMRPIPHSVGGLLLLCCLAVAGGCVRQALVVQTHAGPRPNAPVVVVLQSQDAPLFAAAVNGFVKRCDGQVTVITNTRDASSSAVVDAVRALKPQFIFTLGTPAIRLASKAFTDVPVLYAMALNYASMHTDAAPNIMGIAMEPTALSEFAKFRMVAPELHRVAVMYTEGSTDNVVQKAKDELRELDVELLPIAVPPGGDAAKAYKAHSGESDALWLMDDADVMQQFEAVKRISFAQRKPMLASLSDSFARAGALMAVSIDAESIGSQAASIARRVLEGTATVAEIGVQQPIAVRLVVNTKVAGMLGVQIPEDVLPYISEILP